MGHKRWIDYRILLLESPDWYQGQLKVGVTTNMPSCQVGNKNKIRHLRQWIAEWNKTSDPTESTNNKYRYRLYAHHLTLSQVNQTKPLKGEIRLRRLGVTDLTLIIQSLDGKMVLTDSFLEVRLAHMSATHRQQLLTRLQSMPTNQLDINSIHETPVNSINREVSILNYPANAFVNHIMVGGEEFVPHHVDANLKMVEFRGKYSYHYSAASAEYALEVKNANEKYESDLAHCKKLLHDLPIALKNSQQKLAEDTKSVREQSADIELSDLGALVIEQSVISDEIKLQEERLVQLKPIKVDESKFISHEIQFKINLPFGWHKLDWIVYELTHAPKPLTESENKTLPQSNQHPVSVKRTRQQFESVMTVSPTGVVAPLCRSKHYLSTAAAIRKQVESYFSDSNFGKVASLKKLYESHHGWIPLTEISSFPKMRSLTTDLTTIVDALRASTLLQLNESKTKVTHASDPGSSPTHR